MNFVKTEIEALRKATDFIKTKYGIICFYDDRVAVYSYSFESLYEITGLDGIYGGVLSPDGNKVMLCSVYNYFYILDLSTFSVTDKLVIDNGDDCLGDNKGLWSVDSKSIFIPIMWMHGKILSTIVLTFDTEKLTVVKEEKYENLCFTHSCYHPKIKKSYFVGYDRKRRKANCIFSYDENGIGEAVYLDDTKNCPLYNFYYCEQKQCFVIIGGWDIFFFRPQNNDLQSFKKQVQIKEIRKKYRLSFKDYDYCNGIVLLSDFFNGRLLCLNDSLTNVIYTYEISEPHFSVDKASFISDNQFLVFSAQGNVAFNIEGY